MTAQLNLGLKTPYLMNQPDTRITKKGLKADIQHSIRNNPVAAIKALMLIYDNQTEDEKRAEVTIEDNGIGFTGADDEFLTSLAKQYNEKGSLSRKQIEALQKSMPKYWNQLIPRAEKEAEAKRKH